MKQKRKKTEYSTTGMIIKNKSAHFEYEIVDQWEAGIVLQGTEVKSIRLGRVNIADSYAYVRNGEVFLLNLIIHPYDHGNKQNHEPARTRKLLLNRYEIERLQKGIEQKGLTLVPLRLFWSKGRVKVALGLGRGKKTIDKRDTIKSREGERELQRDFKQGFR